METCQPYGCELVMLFGFLAGSFILGSLFIATHYLIRLSAWIRQFSVNRKQRALDDLYPAWRNTVNTRAFKDWFRAQPEETKTLAASWAPNDAIEVLRRFTISR